MAQELVDDIHRRSEGGKIIFKYDMSKAYDRLEWRFLLRALRGIGFSSAFQDLIYRSICNIRYRVCVNEFYSEEFGSTRGVWQGDPLSPLLFINAHQVLSFNLNKQSTEGTIKLYKLVRNMESISHLFYADDMLIFTNGRVRSLKALRRLMNRYEEPSDQQINLQKVLSMRVNPSYEDEYQEFSGFRDARLRNCRLNILAPHYTRAAVEIIFLMS